MLKVFQTSGNLAPNNGATAGTAAYVNNKYIIANGSNVQPANKISVKGDHVFNEKHRISGYYGYIGNRRSPDRKARRLCPDSIPITTTYARTPT